MEGALGDKGTDLEGEEREGGRFEPGGGGGGEVGREVELILALGFLKELKKPLEDREESGGLGDGCLMSFEVLKGGGVFAFRCFSFCFSGVGAPRKGGGVLDGLFDELPFDFFFTFFFFEPYTQDINKRKKGDKKRG